MSSTKDVQERVCIEELNYATHNYAEICQEENYMTNDETRLMTEGCGRFLNLHELHHDYISSDFGKQIDSTTYLEVFSQTQHIPQKLKLTRQYREYLRKMTDNLVYFLERIKPLQDLDKFFSKVVAEFEEQWSNGKVDGWKDEAQENGYASEQNTSIDDSKQIALMEVYIRKLCEILLEKIKQTKENVEEKRARLYEELDAESEDEEVPDEDQQLGLDGEATPYWLLKLNAHRETIYKEFEYERCRYNNYGDDDSGGDHDGDGGCVVRPVDGLQC